MKAREFRFAHLADAHVGAWSRDPAVRAALRESVLAALRVVDERDCEFLLVSGDLFHTPVPDPAEVAPVAAALRTLVDHGRRVYVIYGSHDYVAHRTSWLDVLAETGIFLRAAPEAVRAEGERWTLPFVVDAPTGARIAGISGRPHGLERGYFRSVDSERFRSEPGFKIFQFHAAIAEYLPPGLREHIEGVAVADLPSGVDYYAGGHIHYTYTGTGPGGGLLVNPGAVFGTSTTDLDNGARGRTRQGVVVVTVRDGHPEVEFVETAPKAAIRVFDVDVSGQSPEVARAALGRALDERSAPGALLFPRLHGVLADGSLGALGLSGVALRGGEAGAATVHWDVTDVAAPPLDGGGPAPSGADLEAEAVHALAASPPAGFPGLGGPEGEARLRELLRELGTPRGEGEQRQEYEGQRVDAALQILGLKAPRPQEP